MTRLSDDLVRSAALAAAHDLRSRFAGRVPTEALSRGITLDGVRVPIWNYQKGIFKPAVLGPDGAALSIHTSASSPYDDQHDPSSGVITYKYRGANPEHADNVALRNAMLRRVPLIYLTALERGVYDIVAPVYIESDDPARLQCSLTADLPAASVSDNAMLVAARRQYATAAVLQRLHQSQFRRVVLAAYGDRCSVCRLKHTALLDAAHILPDRDPRGEPIVTNGLSLCKIHHSAYDANIIGIDPDARIHVREDILHEVDGPMLKHGLQATDGARLQLPRRDDLRPNRDFLAERYARFRAA